jgi:hypothetical protein
MKLSLVIPALLATTALTTAQSVTLRGKVEDVSGTTGQFFLDCTDVDLSSIAFNLNLFVGQHVEIQGTWNGSVGTPAVVVEAIANVPESFEIGGGGKIGEQAHPTVTAAPGSLAFTFASVSTSFLPLGAAGTGFLGGNPFSTGSGTVGGAGVLQLNVPVPNDPSLIGVDIFGQAIVLDAGSFSFTNPDCKELKS